jgi:hypothetical protein
VQVKAHGTDGKQAVHSRTGKETQSMSSSQESQPTFDSIAPRFVVQDMEQALAFYGQLGFATTYQDEGFAIVARDGIDLHLNYSLEPPKGLSVCWIGVTNIEALYQQYFPTNAVQSPLEAKPWGLKEFFIRDPFRNLILFAERISEEEASSVQEGWSGEMVVAIIAIATPPVHTERRLSHAMYGLQERSAPSQLRMDVLTNMQVDADLQRDVRVYHSDLVPHEYTRLAESYLADLKRLTARFLVRATSLEAEQPTRLNGQFRDVLGSRLPRWKMTCTEGIWAPSGRSW